MINALLDLIEFFHSNFAFLFSLILYTILAILLAKSIKKHSNVYYWIFGVLSFCFIIPMVARLTGITLPFNIGQIPLIGLSASELSSAANFIHPILIIIMYMGALSPKITAVGRLMSIRKELSIIVGFPVLAHATKRLFGTFPGGWQYFFDNETFMQNPRVTSALGSGISSFAFVLGLVMTILFLVLWITSFDSVHRKLGSKRWKSVQKWSYGLYAMLFLHSICLQAGSIISSNARVNEQEGSAKVEMVEKSEQKGSKEHVGEQKSQPVSQSASKNGEQKVEQQAKSSGHGHGPRNFSLTSIEVSRTTKQWINIFIYLAIYGSYLFLRVKKARKK